jgi:hypothetical protein
MQGDNSADDEVVYISTNTVNDAARLELQSKVANFFVGQPADIIKLGYEIVFRRKRPLLNTEQKSTAWLEFNMTTDLFLAMNETLAFVTENLRESDLVALEDMIRTITTFDQLVYQRKKPITLQEAIYAAARIVSWTHIDIQQSTLNLIECAGTVTRVVHAHKLLALTCDQLHVIAHDIFTDGYSGDVAAILVDVAMYLHENPTCYMIQCIEGFVEANTSNTSVTMYKDSPLVASLTA